MTAMTALNAERIKLVTIRSPLWSALAAAALSLGVAALQGATAYGAAGLAPQQAAMGVAVFGVPLLMVVAAMTVTGEYRTGTIRYTFAATPNRTLVLAAKAVVCALFSAVFTVVLVIAAVAVARLSADPMIGADLSLAGPEVWRLALALAVFAAVAAVLGVAVGALVRHAAGAVAILLLWPLVVEPILGNLPTVGPRIGPFLPFGNVFTFADVQWLFPTYAMPWGPFGSLCYFVVVVAVAFAAATVVVGSRDA
ncbi:ABC transporter permease [Mycolicibacterium sediminis]|uniref:ABC transporter permease n=1 Tax=Mycolicibacterium sediminis TaxID=1286180 RepID=A0A7I7QP64_9MYCO|nr:ABC transporter permease [Mycolicibacterium sediminis]BBY27797.1 ABC transporter permease [Mycolicibacterium sediminis]